MSCLLPREHSTRNHLAWGQEPCGPVAFQRQGQRLLGQLPVLVGEGWTACPKCSLLPLSCGALEGVGGDMTGHTLPGPRAALFSGYQPSLVEPPVSPGHLLVRVYKLQHLQLGNPGQQKDNTPHFK